MEQSMDEIVRAVTEQVLAALKQQTTLQAAKDEGKEKCLVLGDTQDIPEPLTRNMVLLPLEDYETNQNILRYKQVVITSLSMKELTDIALGRPETPVTCAVCQALLQGVEVLLLEEALPHRVYVGQGSTAFYRLLEGYVNTLQVFGIKLLQNGCLKLAPKESTPERSLVRREIKNTTRLITEDMALKISSEVQELVVPTGTIITPAAMDVLKEAHITLTRR